MSDPGSSPRILVLGASGGLGRRIGDEVISKIGPEALLVGDYRPERGRQTAEQLGATFVSVDARDEDSLRRAVADASAVVVAVQQTQPLAQIACIEGGIPCLDVTVHPELVAQIRSLDARARDGGTCCLVLAGMFPGLSGVMAKHATSMLDETDSLDVALCQNTESSVGATGIADMLGLFAQPVLLREAGEATTVPGFSRKRTFHYPMPFGEKTHRLANFVEGGALSEVLNLHDVNLWTGYNKPGFDRLLGALNTVKILSLFNRPGLRTRLAKLIDSGMSSNGPAAEPCAVVARAEGKKDGQARVASVSLSAPSDYGTTASSVVASTRLLLSGDAGAPGVFYPFEVIELRTLTEMMADSELELFEALEP